MSDLRKATHRNRPKGTEFGAAMTFSWAINKNAVQIRWSGKAAPKEAVEFVKRVGWDAKQMKLISQDSARWALSNITFGVETVRR